MNILIGGDLVPTKENFELFNNGYLESLLGNDLKNIWLNSDVRIFNLEAPLYDREKPINKWGPNLLAPTSVISGIEKLEPSLITLANNHILDHDTKGLKSTIDILNKKKLPHVGVGNNIFEASAGYVIEHSGVKIGIYACTENEFSAAKENSAGANPFDPIDSLEHISNLKKKSDYVIVLYHGGKEHYRYPSPYLQKISRKMVERGADIVICQHSHCIGAKEVYKDSTIIYGQGNFIFKRKSNEYWNTSVIINIILKDNIELEYIPIVATEQGTRLADANESAAILNDFLRRTQEIKKKGFVLEQYQNYADAQLDNYLRGLSGLSKWFYRFDKYICRGSLMKKIYNERSLLAIQNYVECEA
ncbi:CapA family protein, partial [Alkalibacterium sp. 20]|uniref:CapA family protein n=1 Tax=Alkalibacterium sp. 20 TaxID=1798803 RepID=UPI000919D723